MRRVLVTGAGGFLGSHLCHLLAGERLADEVLGLDTFTRGHPPRGDHGARLRFETADVRDATALARCLAGVDVVCHLAAIADPRACAADPSRARAVNVDGTASVVRAAAGRRLVFLSSAAVYGATEAAPLAEDARVAADDPYAATKLAGERLCLEATHAGHLTAVVVRNFNTYGGGQEASYLVPQIVRQALAEGRITIRGCGAIRDFTFVDDTVRALAALASDDVPPGVYNLGSGEGRGVGETALAVGAITGAAVGCLHGASAGRPALVASAAKLRGATGWRPAVGWAEGLARTVAWFRAHPAPTP